MASEQRAAEGFWNGAAQYKAVAIASNESFSGWTKTFTHPRLWAAIVDRLTFGGNIIETGAASYRLAHAQAQRAGQPAERNGTYPTCPQARAEPVFWPPRLPGFAAASRP